MRTPGIAVKIVFASYVIALAFLAAPLPVFACGTLGQACAKQKKKNYDKQVCEGLSTDQQKKACHAGCANVDAACAGAAGECGGLAAQESIACSTGQQGTQAPADGLGENNAESMGAAGQSACAAQKANQARQAADQGVPPAMAKCKAAADACKGAASGQDPASEARQSADDAAEEAAKQAGQRGQDAAKMGQMCNKDKQNESKMPQMPQMPPPPEKKSDDKQPENQTPYDSSVASGTSPTTSTDTSVKIDTVKFGDEAKNGEVEMKPTNPPSQLTGTTPGGGTFGGGSGPNFGPGNDRFAGSGNGKEPPGTYAPKGGNGGSGTGSSQSLKSKDGIAAADINPEPNNYEVNPGSGKSMLGIKGGRSDEDDAAAAVAAIGTGKGKDDGKGASGRGPSGGAGANAGGTEDPNYVSLFKMVKERYKTLRELGQI